MIPILEGMAYISFSMTGSYSLETISSQFIPNYTLKISNPDAQHAKQSPCRRLSLAIAHSRNLSSLPNHKVPFLCE